ncbi:MAG: transporter substrate-binding domain-containing protein [Thermodesulfobacteriota bacterium]|nr:transporter substrate-binding domain-containing protein [Thermodesulfobacteriota bacterium]
MTISIKTIPLTLFLCFIYCLAPFTGVAPAADNTEEKPDIRIGIRSIKPFIFLNEKDPDQEPTGFSIDLWKAISKEIGVTFTYVPSQGISHTLDDIMNGRIDLAIGAISVTKDREEKIDFSYSNFHTGLSILVPDNEHFSMSAFLYSFFNVQRLRTAGFFLLFLIISGHVIWLAERRTSHTFHHNYLPGIFEGLYWSIVTASTVGYGDFTPKSTTGRILSIIVIIVSLPLFAIFVANISSNITLQKLQTSITGPMDLVGHHVGVVDGSTGHDFIEKLGVKKLHTFASIKDACNQLHDGQLDAVVGDRPALQYYQEHDGKGRERVLDATFAKQNYAIAMAEGNRYRENINRILLKLIEDGTYQEIREIWFGQEYP